MSTKFCTPIALTSCAALLPSLAEVFRRTEPSGTSHLLKRCNCHDRFPRQQRGRARGPVAHRLMVTLVSGVLERLPELAEHVEHVRNIRSFQSGRIRVARAQICWCGVGRQGFGAGPAAPADGTPGERPDLAARPRPGWSQSVPRPTSLWCLDAGPSGKAESVGGLPDRTTACLLDIDVARPFPPLRAVHPSAALCPALPEAATSCPELQGKRGGLQRLERK
jgi:hypothetical protein